MKIFKIALLFIFAVSFAQAFDGEKLKVTCQASDGSSFVMDQFQNDPCQIRQIKAGHEEVVTGVSLCIFPNEVHDMFSFWWMVPHQSKAELVGELEPVGSSFQGSLSFNTATGSALVKLDCQAAEAPSL